MATAKKKPPRKGPRPKYPWDQWFNRLSAGRKVQLQKNKHYDCQTHGMVAQIRTRASQRNVQLVITVTNDTTITMEHA